MRKLTVDGASFGCKEHGVALQPLRPRLWASLSGQRKDFESCILRAVRPE